MIWRQLLGDAVTWWIINYDLGTSSTTTYTGEVRKKKINIKLVAYLACSLPVHIICQVFLALVNPVLALPHSLLNRQYKRSYAQGRFQK